ncbi:hypothetical protein J437_LFUL014383 [Ladona fulva]|uniref:Uncharacterized protein n=1 Tax=Ladona fulva TaxID=123851 RepID=A0A8K0KHR5_LADFU|nr:hypothetical protein J437_LFUL014383 [Ladona fulva]
MPSGKDPERNGRTTSDRRRANYASPKSEVSNRGSDLEKQNLGVFESSASFKDKKRKHKRVGRKTKKKRHSRNEGYDCTGIPVKPLVEYSDVSSEDLSEPEAGEIQSDDSFRASLSEGEVSPVPKKRRKKSKTKLSDDIGRRRMREISPASVKEEKRDRNLSPSPLRSDMTIFKSIKVKDENKSPVEDQKSDRHHSKNVSNSPSRRCEKHQRDRSHTPLEQSKGDDQLRGVTLSPVPEKKVSNSPYSVGNEKGRERSASPHSLSDHKKGRDGLNSDNAERRRDKRDRKEKKHRHDKDKKKLKSPQRRKKRKRNSASLSPHSNAGTGVDGGSSVDILRSVQPDNWKSSGGIDNASVISFQEKRRLESYSPRDSDSFPQYSGVSPRREVSAGYSPPVSPNSPQAVRAPSSPHSPHTPPLPPKAYEKLAGQVQNLPIRSGTISSSSHRSASTEGQLTAYRSVSPAPILSVSSKSSPSKRKKSSSRNHRSRREKSRKSRSRTRSPVRYVNRYYYL